MVLYLKIEIHGKRISLYNFDYCFFLLKIKEMYCLCILILLIAIIFIAFLILVVKKEKFMGAIDNGDRVKEKDVSKSYYEFREEDRIIRQQRKDRKKDLMTELEDNYCRHLDLDKHTPYDKANEERNSQDVCIQPIEHEPRNFSRQRVVQTKTDYIVKFMSDIQDAIEPRIQGNHSFLK